MDDQESFLESDERTSVEGFINHRLSDLHLDIMSTDSSTNAVCNRAAGVDDSESYHVEFADSSPPRLAYGRKVSLKRRTPSSSYSPPQSPAGDDVGFHRLMSNLHLDIVSTDSSTNAVCNRAAGVDDSVSNQLNFADPSPRKKRMYHNRRSTSSTSSSPQPPAGYPFLDLPGEDSGPKGSSSLSHISLDCTGVKPIPAAEVENQQRRSLFPSQMSSSGATTAILPPLPLGRTASDPVRLRSLMNPVSPAQEITPVPRREDNYPTAAHLLPPHRPVARTASDRTRLTNSILQNSPYEGFNSTEESPSVKSLQRAGSAKIILQQINEIKDFIDQLVEEDTAMINDPIIPEPEIPAEKTMSMTNEAPPQEEVVEKEMEEGDDLEAEADLVKARKVGECTMLEFKCRCGSIHSVAIFGNSCYYKLI